MTKLEPGMILKGWSQMYVVTKNMQLRNIVIGSYLKCPATTLEDLRNHYRHSDFRIMKWTPEAKDKFYRKARTLMSPSEFLATYGVDYEKVKLGTVYSTSSNSYTFRGSINLYHLTNDCIKDQKSAFIAIEKDSAILGISKQLQSKHLDAFIDSTRATKAGFGHLAFTILYLDKIHIEKAMKFAATIPSIMKKDIRTAAKTLHRDKKAGKFSNAAETKVMVY